jgi:hypothetical protein
MRVAIFSRGLTLVEILIGLTITVLLATVIGQGGATLSRHLARGRFEQVARHLIQERLTELELDGVRLGTRDTRGAKPFERFSMRESAVPVDLPKLSFPGLADVTVQIVWDGPAGPEELAVRTIVRAIATTGLATGPVDGGSQAGSR